MVVVLVILGSTMWLAAQDQMSKSSSGPTTIQGCLSYTDGHYRLTDSSGKVYQLSNEANKLTHHVGHEIKVTGMPGVRTVDTTQQGAGESTVKEQPVFKVKTVTHVADTCNAGK
jgi:hypothetical protein